MLIRFVASLFVISLAIHPVVAQNFAFYRIASTGESPPDNPGVPYSGTLFNNNNGVNANGTVVFSQESGTTGGGNFTKSIYLGQSGGNVSVLVPFDTTMPGAAPSGSLFRGFGTSFAIDGDRAVFYGFNATTTGSATWRGVYLASPGSVSVVADYATPIPDQPAGTFFTSLGNSTTNTAGQWSISGANVAFRGIGTGLEGNYVSMGGDLRTLHDTTTEVPGHAGTFFSGVPSHPRVSGSFAVGRGESIVSPQSIVFRDLSNPANPLITIADYSTQMPGQSPGVNFGSLIFDPDISGNTVTFTGRVSTSGAARGIYRAVWDGSSFGPLSVVADNTTLVPGTGSTFTDFPASQAIDGNRVVFRGTGGGVTAVYLAEGGEIRRVIGPGDEIDGLTVATGTTAVTMGPNAINGDWITFNVNFTNGSRSLVSVQITPVPEPMLLLLALPLAFLRRR